MLQEVCVFFRNASNQELIDMFGDCDMDYIFENYTELEICNKIHDVS